MKIIKYVMFLMLVLMVGCAFAETDKIISQKNEYGGKTLEDDEGLPGTGLHRVVSYYDQKGKIAKRDYYGDGKSLASPYRTTEYFDRNGTSLFEDYFDKNGNHVEDGTGYRYIGLTPDGAAYYRPKDVLRMANNRIRVWCKVILSNKMKSEIAAAYKGKADNISYIESLHEIDLKNQKWTERLIRLYDQTNRLIDSDELKESELEWSDMDKTSPIWRIYNIVNNRRR